MYHQHDNQHDQLSGEYDELMKASHGDSVLRLLEKELNPFDAKQVLSSLFTVNLICSLFETFIA